MIRKRIRGVIAGFLGILLFQGALAKSVDANDPRIQLMGRFDASDPKAPVSDWPAVNLRVLVKGRALTLLVEDPKGQNHFNLYVDGRPVSIVAAKAGLNRIVVPGLGKGPSQVMLSKRTEGFQGAVAFRGLELGKGTVLLEPSPLPDRRIEFIGDSWSCGYGNEGVTHGNCPNLTAVSNADRAYPVFLANKLHAQYHVTAASGRGILRNYGEKTDRSEDPLPPAFGRTLFSRPGPAWDCSKWVPDVVVLRLGVNDHSTQPAPTEEDFTKAYAAFLDRLRTCYPKAEIFCFGDEGWPDYKPRILKAMELRRGKGDRGIHWVGNRGFGTSELGCDWHPSAKAHWELAEQLESAIRPVTGWNEVNEPTPTPTGVPRRNRPTPTPTRVPVAIPPPPED